MKFELNPFKYNFKVGNDKKKKNLISYFPIIIVLLLLSWLSYIPPKKSITNTNLKTGDILRNDIVIKKDLTIVDKELTREKKDNVKSGVIPVYEFLPDIKEKRTELINNWINLIRKSRKEYYRKKSIIKKLLAEINNNFGLDLKEKDLIFIFRRNIFGKLNVDDLLNEIRKLAANGIISAKNSALISSKGTIKVIFKGKQPKIFNINRLFDLKDIEVHLRDYLEKDKKFSKKESELISSILMEFIDVNLSYSLNLTKQAIDEATASVNPVVIKLKTGRIILRKGDEIKPSDLKIIKLIEKEEHVRSKKLPYFYFILIILTLILFLTGKLLKIWENKGINGKKLITVSLFTLLIGIVIYRISLFILPIIFKNLTLSFNIDLTISIYALPYTFGALIIAFIFNIESAVIFSFVNSIVGGILADWNLFVFLYILIGSLIVTFGIEYYQRLKRSPILKVSLLWLIPVNIIYLLLFNLTNGETDTILLLTYAGTGIFSALISAILASFLIPLWEIIFNLLTDLKLVELTNLNLPIFREMLEKAPGTYHHSQMVSSLSETAALDLGLSPLLLNAMALYHDIGKIDNPQVFTENHSIYPDPHKDLTPKESAKLIISHIKNGLERAKNLKLSEIISSAISQHHGTKLVSFFFNKAVESSSDASPEIDKNLFRYPGEKPKNIENAIIMLADQVEAASKSLSSPTDDELRNVIQKIVNSDIEDGQFDECDGLTLKSINIISNSFYKKLSSIYHMRISYPGFNFKEDKESDNDND